LLAAADDPVPPSRKQKGKAIEVTEHTETHREKFTDVTDAHR
jgi:hypothetical protein